ncbi:MAG: sugar transferase [Patescibacteria group bacterium]|nr:sugar transferase [Patescibacteria group bacterium]
MKSNIKQFALLLGDILIMNLALYLALWLRYGENPALGNWGINWGPFAVVFIIWLIAFYISNLYNLHLAINNGLFFQRITQSFAIAAILAVIYFYLAPPDKLTPKTNLAVFFVVFAVLFIVWRQLFNSLLKSYLPRTNLAVIGFNNLVEKIIMELKQKPQLGLSLSFILDEKATGKELNGTPIFNNINDLPALIEKRKINNVILAAAPDSQELRALLFECLPLKITFINLADFYENIAGKIPLEVINKMWFLENLNEGNKNNFDLFKRTADLVLALLIFIITLPFWLIIALIIKLESRGTIFFVQTRAGERGKNFRMIKFRTMKTENNDHSPTTDGDRRVTRFGSFLRKTRLDEIPQVLNIIKGEMSFVGPRPERPELIETLEKQIPFYRERMLVKPGVTGTDQISGEYHSPSYEDTMKKLQYDLYYIKNRSVYLELSIILKTISTVLSRAGR